MIDRLFTIATTDADLQRRGRTLITIALLLVGLEVLSLPLLFFRPDPRSSLITIGLGLLMIVAVIWLSKMGRITLAGWIMVGVSTMAIAVPPLIRREVSTTLFYLLLPPVMAGVVLRPRQIWIALAASLGVIGAVIAVTPAADRANNTAITIVGSAALLTLITGLIGYLGAKISTEAFANSAQARAAAEAAAQALEQLNDTLEDEVHSRTMELRAALVNVEARDAEKQSLIDEVNLQRAQIREMSVPVLPVDRYTLVMPLVGSLDSQRIMQLQEQALGAVERLRARVLLIDITGVPIVDSQVAQGLISTIAAVRLLGAEPVLIGVRPEVAQALVALGIDLGNLRTASDLQGALHQHVH